MSDPNDSKLKDAANTLVSELLTRIGEALKQDPETLSTLRGLGYNCSGSSFLCGEYACTKDVKCKGDFSCTLKFTEPPVKIF